MEMNLKELDGIAAAWIDARTRRYEQATRKQQEAIWNEGYQAGYQVGKSKREERRRAINAAASGFITSMNINGIEMTRQADGSWTSTPSLGLVLPEQGERPQ